jgi:hypothetical protein
LTIESECPVWLRYIGCSKKNIKGLGQIFLRELSGFRAAGPAQNIPLGPRLVIPLGPRSVQPARFAQAGPVWFPRTKTGGAPPGFPCGSRFPPGAGPTRGPSACVGWVRCCKGSKAYKSTLKKTNGHLFLIEISFMHSTINQSTMPTNSVSLHMARKIFTYLLTYIP